MSNKAKKIFIKIVLGIYLITNFFQSAFYAGNKVYAARDQNGHEDPVNYTNIVAVIVNDDIYDRLKNYIEWYATEYIQGDGDNQYNAISNSKALVFPINTSNFSAKNITQLLENIYFGGIEGETSKLVGVVLIGDIPLPVVNQNGYIFPTIYPYVDFEEQKFIWNDDIKYFVYNNNPKGQAEIWHGVIDFGDNIQEYKTYFEKLQDYRRDPTSFIGKAIWYEDFIGNTKYFNDTALNSYLNNFIFAEDLGYHRYSDLLIRVLQGQRNNEIQELIQGLTGGDINTGLEALAASTTVDMNTPTMQIETVLKNGYLSNYTSLFGQKYLSTISKNVETANRWLETLNENGSGKKYYTNALDTVYKKAELTDEVLLRKDSGMEPFLIMLNNALEEAVDTKVEQEKYWMDEVIPLTYLKYEGSVRNTLGGKKCVWNIYDAYENYFFGQNAKFVQSMEETTTYRGTFRNYDFIDGKTIADIQNSENPSTDVSGLDLNKKSIGGSYEIFAEQVDANRGYNYNNSLSEFEIYSGNKTAKMENRGIQCTYRLFWICRKRRWSISTTDGSGCDLISEDGDQGGCEGPEEYALRVWGGASPLNITSDGGGGFVWTSGYSYTGATSPVFDIAGSTALDSSNPEYESNSFEAVKAYSNLTLRKFSPATDKLKFKASNKSKKKPAPDGLGYDYSMDYDVKFTNMIPVFDEDDDTVIEAWTGKAPKTADSVDFFKIYNVSDIKQKEGNVIKLQKTRIPGTTDNCQGAGEIYTYKTLDSRVKNDSVNKEELNSNSYMVFEDDISPVKQFYDRLRDYIDAVYVDIDSFAGDGTGSLSGKTYDLKNQIDAVISGLSGLASFNINSLTGKSTGEINDLAAERDSIFGDDVASGIYQAATELQNLIIDMSGFVEASESLLVGIVEFVDREKASFIANQRNLIFLDERKDTLSGDIRKIINSLSMVKSVIGTARSRYETGIRDIVVQYPPLGQILEGEYNNLMELQNGSGCEMKYINLCNALSGVIKNYNNVAGMIDTAKTNMPIFNDSGDITNVQGPLIWMVLKSLENSPTINITGSNANLIFNVMYNGIDNIPETGNAGLMGVIPGMNATTSDRPIDSPRYLTFKGIGGNKVTFIYPDIYKAEIFSGDSNVLSLKSPSEIADAIRDYLKRVVIQYNTYLTQQNQKHTTYYNENAEAFNLLTGLSTLASPEYVNDSIRPYNLFDTGYLIDRLERQIRTSVARGYLYGDPLAQEDPILFIANMMYYQNITWPTRITSGTIQGDFDNQRTNFDINEKVSYLVDNYLISDNNRGNYLTPTYRDNGYEVAYINSDGNDYIAYEVDVPTSIAKIKEKTYEAPTTIPEDMSNLEEELINECNIPLDGGVLLFAFSGNSSEGNITSPWWDALKCRWEKIKEKPFEFQITFPFTWDTGASFTGNLYDFFDLDAYKEIGLTYPEQLKLLNTDEANEALFEQMDLSNPGDGAKLHGIASYTLITTDKANVSADDPKGKINISSSKPLDNVEFYVVAMGIDKIALEDWGESISSNITISDDGYNTGHFSFDPYYGKNLDYEIINPKEGYNVIMFYMCLPGTHNLNNCARKSIKLDVVPGEIRHIYIEKDKSLVLEGASLPFNVKGTDQFGNNVGELISQKFLTSVSSGTVTLNGTTSTGIRFSNFNKANFKFNAVGGNLDRKVVTIQVSGLILGEPGVKASTGVTVIKGKMDVYSGNLKLSSGADIITGISMQLPDRDIYFNVDRNNLNQANTSTIPKIQLKIVDMRGAHINIDGTATVKTKNGKFSPGIISHKTVSRTIDGTTVDLDQYSFSKTSSFEISGGYATVYLLPSFSAGEDVLNISMPGIDDIHIPMYVRAGNPSIIKLSSDTDVLRTNSSTIAKLKIFDNRNNLMDRDVNIVLVSTDDTRLSLSASASGNLNVSGGALDFDIYSHNRGGFGYVYAMINTGDIPEEMQSPDQLTLTVQKRMLPETGLNIMYLNLFGGDWGNQWGYMSDNEKFAESLINNSDKLIAVTTQLLDYENIKYFPVVINKSLHVINLIGKKISFEVNSGFVFDIDSIGQIKISQDTFKLEEANVTEDVIEQHIQYAMTTGDDKGKNVLFYIPEQTDSILSGNKVINGDIYINGEKVFSLRDSTFDMRLSTKLTENTIAGYQVWELFFDDTFAGKFIFAVDSNEPINISLESKSPEYGVAQTWTDGSSDKYGLGFYLLNSELSSSTFGYKSIQDSYDINLGIGFTADFKNITNFGGGMPVGESTLPFSSELLINIGDPLLKRIDGNKSAKIYDQSGDVQKDTKFDLGLGEVIYSEPSKDIHKVINIDFNNDGLEDIIVIFKDGTIKILKNYGGTNPFQKLGDLMILADRINDVSVGDVDGNGYEDLLVWTEVGGLRVYLNNKGIFDVDGYPVCINVNVGTGEISEHPENIAGVYQIFLEDMDQDNALDIVTNDYLGFIKIFYGGTGSDGNVHYLSTNKYMCDDDWYTRVSSNSQTVYQFGVMMYAGHILDQSLVRWQGISGSGVNGDITPEALGMSGGLLETGNVSVDNLLDVLSNLTHMDVSAAESIYQQDNRLKQSGFSVIPIYETNTNNPADIEYVEIGCLTGVDPVKIYKTYENVKDNSIDWNSYDTGLLINGDLVRVTVHVEANEDFSGTFIDNIVGPWLIPLYEENEETFENFWFDSSYVERRYITSGQIQDMADNMHRDLDNARYMIDNIHMREGDRFAFSYGLVYNNSTIMDIDVSTLTGKDFSKYLLDGESINGFAGHDQYPDISVQPQDGCNDSMFIFFNQGEQTGHNTRGYTQKYVDLGKFMREYYAQAEENSQSATNAVLNGANGSGSSSTAHSGSTDGSAVQGIQDYVFSLAGISESIDWKGMLTSDGLNLSQMINNPLMALDEELGFNEIAAELDEMIGSACKGNSLLGGNSCAGLPVPFNQAFLGEGKYHIFGCYNLDFLDELIGSGWPAMTFPGNRGPTPVGAYLPFPGIFGYPFKGATFDEFVRFVLPNGTYPSMFRLYLMPTLTMQLGIALCFGPYNLAGVDIPDPFGDIAGNCVVFAVSIPCGDGSDEQNGPNATQETPYEYTLLKGCSAQNVPCYIGNNESSTPFVAGGYNGNQIIPVVPEGSYAGGFINIEVSPQASPAYKESSPLDMQTLTLKGGAAVQNKIRGSKDQGLIQIIVKDWLDRQIKYIINNLTNFKVSLILPDFEAMLGNVSDISIEGGSFSGLTNKYEETEQEKCENRGKQRDAANKKCIDKVSKNFEDESWASVDEWSQKTLLSREEISSRSNYTNPFEELAKVFDETPLVNISTQDLVVNVPMLSSEDITSYLSMSQSWVNRQTEILEERTDFFKAVIGLCGGNTNINGAADLESAIKELEEQYKDANEYSNGDAGDQQILADLQGKIDALKDLRQKYNLSDLGNYKIYEEQSGGYYVYTTYPDPGNSILPKDVYIYYNPDTSNLSMFTSGFDLRIDNTGSKPKVSIEKNNDSFSNKGLRIKYATEEVQHSCAALFNGGTINNALRGFLNMQATAETLLISVKQNMETLQQYKKFPLQLYDWIHVIDRYLGDISSLLNSTIGTLSLWMETNANRFSQYIDAIIAITTTLETYQMIIDFSVDWTESCSTCTNDNYDQFSCKLGGICDMLGLELPVISIPSMKIPSLYLDFSEIHVESDIKLPNLKFNPVAVPLPELPNLPSPPDIDLSMGIDEALSMGIDLIGQLMGLDFGSLSFDAGKIPLIPSPPTLPELPSFIPTVEMELPLLPPAPKIPELPDSIKGAIKAAKLIGKILCIIKGKIGLVYEKDIKAKVEQITQRTYQVPYWDNFDKTRDDLKTNADSTLGSFWGSVFTGFAALLQTNEFKDSNMKGFDLYLQAYVNIQFNLDHFYSFLEAVINEVNGISYKITDYENQGTDYISKLSQRFTKKLQACANNMISVECLGEGSADLLQQYNERLNQIKESRKRLETSSEELDILLAEIEKRKDEIQDLNKEIEELNTELNNMVNPTQQYIDNITAEINGKRDRIRQLQSEITELNSRYGETASAYNELRELYRTLTENFDALRNNLLERGKEVVEQVQSEIDNAGESVNFEDMKDFERSIKEEGEAADTKKEIEKSTRSDNLQNLYKDVEGSISYVDYNKETNENNFKILQDVLTEINTETNNKDLKNKSQEYLNLIATDRNVEANTDSLLQVERQYNTVINDYKSNNDEIMDLVEKDYDKFLAAVSDNDKSLVSSNKSLDVTLSAKLFNMDPNSMAEISNHDNVMKSYIDYNMRNVDGYLNALNTYSAEKLNMSEDTYNMSKQYLTNIKDLATKAYDTIDNDTKKGNGTNDMVLLAQSVGGGNNGNGGSRAGGQGNSSNRSSSTIDIANYIQGSSLNTKEGSFSLANEDYLKKFQSQFVLTDINGDNMSDLIMRDEHNVYIKYRGENSEFTGADYDSHFYSYYIESYEKLVNDADDKGIVKIRYPRRLLSNGTINVKLVDKNWETKNFKYVGQTFDSIKVSRLNNTVLGDKVDGYLVKMIHRVDQFNDHESLINQGNNSELFDKKYVLVLPKGSEVTGMNLEIEERILNNVETHVGTGDIIFSLMFFNPGDEKINLVVTDLPRHWQYSEIYTLNFEDNTYKITSSSSNQVVAGPQIIADIEGPEVEIKLYRPATDSIVSEGTNLKGYVGTNYILQADWEDNVALDEIWIADDMGNTIDRQTNITQRTGYIELSGLYFTGAESLRYYLGGVDIDGNRYVEEVLLSIEVPTIEITDITRGNQGLNYLNGSLLYNSLTRGNIPNVGDGESVVSILAELNQDIDSGYIQFLRNRTSDKRELLTGKINGYNITDFEVSPGVTGFYGGYFDIGNDIGLYSASGDMVAKINPTNGKITITPGFENTVSIRLDYSPKIPVVKVMQGGRVLFRIIYSSEELINLNVSSSDVSIENLNNELFGEFDGGKALLKNNEVLLYVSPKGQIYTDNNLYGEYGFDDATNSVIYTFRDSANGANMGSVKTKIKNLLEY